RDEGRCKGALPRLPGHRGAGAACGRSPFFDQGGQHRRRQGLPPGGAAEVLARPAQRAAAERQGAVDLLPQLEGGAAAERLRRGTGAEPRGDDHAVLPGAVRRPALPGVATTAQLGTRLILPVFCWSTGFSLRAVAQSEACTPTKDSGDRSEKENSSPYR